jgi:hypothetical protein
VDAGLESPNYLPEAVRQQLMGGGLDMNQSVEEGDDVEAMFAEAPAPVVEEEVITEE